MNLRRATLADAAAVGRIHVESWNVAYRSIMPDDVIARTDLTYRTKFWGERIADPEWPVFVIAEEGEIVAFCQMTPSRDPDDDPPASATSHRSTCSRTCGAAATAAPFWTTSAPSFGSGGLRS